MDPLQGRVTGRRVVVFGGGNPPSPRAIERLPAGALVIAADSGYDHARAHGIDVDQLVGDLDSISPDALEAAKAAGVPIDLYPDGQGCDRPRSRAPHGARRWSARTSRSSPGTAGASTTSSPALLALADPALADAVVEAWIGDAWVRRAPRSRSRELHGRPGELVTLAAVGGPAIGVRTEALVYPLHDETLEPGSTRGVSNVFEGTEATVSLAEGTLLDRATGGAGMKRIAIALAALLVRRRVRRRCGRRRRPSTHEHVERAVTITLLTHDSFAVSDGLLDGFTEQTGITVKVLQAGDAGEMVNQAILTKGKPLGDVLYGVDNTFLARAVDAGIFEPYSLAGAERRGPGSSPTRPASGAVTPIDVGDVCLNYDKAWFAEHERRAADLARRPHQARVQGSPRRREPRDVVAGPRVHVGDDRPVRRGRLARLLEAAARRTASRSIDGWEDAYYTDVLRQLGQGRPSRIVVSYASSPPAEVVLRGDAARPTHRLRSSSRPASARSSSRACSRAPSTPPRRKRSSTSC